MEMAANLNFTGDKQVTAAEQIEKLYNLFIAVDATQVSLPRYPYLIRSRDETLKEIYNLC